MSFTNTCWISTSRRIWTGLLALVPLSVAAGAPAAAAPASAPAKKPAARASAPAKPGPKLKSISVVPTDVKLVGHRAEQGLIVTGHYADGTVRDLTTAAQYRVSNPRVAAVQTYVTRRLVRPIADGPARVTVTVPGVAAAEVSVQVVKTGELAPVSFKDEVIPALTKAGCSMGTCHGTPTGKGGFRLSLQGYAPELDYQSIVQEGDGRRVNKADPGRSLLLLKPMVEVAHGGGKRLSRDMPEFDVLSRWIAEGLHDDPADAPTLTKVEVLPGPRVLSLPGAKQQVTAVAHFSDGTVRDVTRVAKLSSSDEDTATVTREGLVEGIKRGEVAISVRYQEVLTSSRITFLQDVPGFQWNNPPVVNYVDQHVFDRLKLFQIPASGLSDDTEFLRRAFLDTLGMLPKPEEVRAFLADKSPDKRAKLIDALTERPEFAEHWALKWADVLRIQDETLKEQGAKAFHKWVRDSIAANKPMDQFVREILTASGPTFSVAPANFFRTMEQPNDMSETTAQLFMGVRMGCAKCHNHPFERWTQDEYYSLAAFFAQVGRGKGTSKDEETIRLRPKGEVTHLRTGKVMKPKLLGAGFPEIAEGQDRRTVLAEWLTKKENPFFAKSIVNRTWANMLGRGIVEPIDDFRDSNPPVNGPLLEALAKDFVAHNFDFRYLVRTIMNSRTYQLTARTLPLNSEDNTYFSHALTRMMGAEQVVDAIAQFTGVPDEFEGYPAGTRAMQIAGTKARTPLMKTFGRPERNLPCECEREKEPNLFQALTMLTSRVIHNKLRSDNGRIAKLAASNMTDEQALEELYLAALARTPTPNEKRKFLAHFSEVGNRREALEDAAYALMNSKEFLFRH